MKRSPCLIKLPKTPQYPTRLIQTRRRNGKYEVVIVPTTQGDSRTNRRIVDGLIAELPAASAYETEADAEREQRRLMEES